MYQNITEAKLAHENGELSTKAFYNLELYFQAASKPAEDIYVLDDWIYDDDENGDLVTYHDPIMVTRKELFTNYSLKELTKRFRDVIDCEGHCLTKEELQNIIWNMGN